MGICESIIHPKTASTSSDEITRETKQVVLLNHAEPITQEEINELYSYESAICKIRIITKKGGKKVNVTYTGFFCEINDDNIHPKKALFTNNHILNEKDIENNKEIELEILKSIKKIIITGDRRKCTSKELDYTFIEIFDKDNINNFFKIDKKFFQIKNPEEKKKRNLYIAI